MDLTAVLSKQGYRLEDLDDDSRHVMLGMIWLRDDFDENFEYEIGEDESSIIGRMKMEIAEDVLSQVLYWLDCEIAEHQISFAENQE